MVFIPDLRIHTSPSLARNRIFYIEMRSIKKDGNTQLIPPHNIFHVYKVFLFDIWKQFYRMLESIEFSLTRYPVFPLRCVCFYLQSIFVLYFILGSQDDNRASKKIRDQKKTKVLTMMCLTCHNILYNIYNSR